MAPIADMLRLMDKQRRQTVRALRRACDDICEIDTRYELTVESARETGMWNLVAMRRRLPAPMGAMAVWANALGDQQPGLRATEATPQGDRGNATRATEATRQGDPGNAGAAVVPPSSDRSLLTTRATQTTLFWPSDGLLQTGVADGPVQTMPVLSHRDGPRPAPNGDGHDTTERT